MLKKLLPLCIIEFFAQLKLLLWKNIIAEFNKSTFESFIMLFEILWVLLCWCLINSPIGTPDEADPMYNYENLTSIRWGSDIGKTFYYPNVSFVTEIMLRVASDLRLEPEGMY